MLGLSCVADAKTLRVIKRTMPEALHVYWVQPGRGNEVQIIALPSVMEAGDIFDVIDDKGYVGRVRVTKSVEENAGCKDFTFKRGTGVFDGSPRSYNSSQAVAIGPMREAPTKAKVVNPADLSKLPALPADHQQMQRMFIDLDGDGGVDVIRDWSMCSGAGGAAGAGGRQYYCVETQARKGTGGWKQFDNVRVNSCY